MSRRQKSDLEPELTPEEIHEAFPCVFDLSFNYRQLDRMAGFWEACGLTTEIITTGAGYALVLHHPDEAG